MDPTILYVGIGVLCLIVLITLIMLFKKMIK